MTHPLAALIAGVIDAYAEKIFDAPIYHYDSEATGKPEAILFSDFGLGVDVDDAQALGIYLVRGNRWHGLSDIRRDEIRDTEIAVMRKALAPLRDNVLAALEAAPVPDLVAEANELLPDLQRAADDGDIDCKEAVRLIRALIDLATAQAAQIAGMIDADTVQKMLDSAQPIMAEACRGYEETIADLQTKAATLRDEVERLRGAVLQKVAECLAGMTYREVSQEARARIKRALDAALGGKA